MLKVASIKIHRAIVKRDDLLIMGHIILAGAAMIVVDEMGERRYRPLVIKGSVSMGNNQDQFCTNPQDPLPLHECAERIGQMLDGVRRQQEVVAAGSDRVQVSGFTDELISRLPERIEPERI